MMEYYINELSLEGQFESEEAFLRESKDFLQVLTQVEALNFKVKKKTSLFEQKICNERTLHDIVKIRTSDQVRKTKSLLLKLSGTPPYWDEQKKVDDRICYFQGKDVSDTSLGQAASYGENLISFNHPMYFDKNLDILIEEEAIKVGSVGSRVFLAELIRDRLDFCTYLKMRFAETRLDFTLMEEEHGWKDLQQHERLDAIESFLRFCSYSDWKGIQQDRKFNYKSYKPPGKKEDWFANSDFADRSIDKFRAGTQSPLRCFGFRDKDNFFVLRIERDHTISDHG